MYYSSSKRQCTQITFDLFADPKDFIPAEKILQNQRNMKMKKQSLENSIINCSNKKRKLNEINNDNQNIKPSSIQITNIEHNNNNIPKKKRKLNNIYQCEYSSLSPPNSNNMIPSFYQKPNVSQINIYSQNNQHNKENLPKSPSISAISQQPNLLNNHSNSFNKNKFSHSRSYLMSYSMSKSINGTRTSPITSPSPYAQYRNNNTNIHKAIRPLSNNTILSRSISISSTSTSPSNHYLHPNINQYHSQNQFIDNNNNDNDILSVPDLSPMPQINDNINDNNNMSNMNEMKTNYRCICQ